MKLGLLNTAIISIIPIPTGLQGRNRQGQELYHKGYLDAVKGIIPPTTSTGAIMADISYREGYKRGWV